MKVLSSPSSSHGLDASAPSDTSRAGFGRVLLDKPSDAGGPIWVDSVAVGCLRPSDIL